MTRPRDSQATKVWNAIGQLRFQNAQLDQKTLQSIANRLVKSAWFKRRARRSGEAYTVIFGRVTTCVDRNFCQLGEGQHNTIDLLHQVAHYMLPPDVAWHGPDFAKLMLELVGHVGLNPTLDKTPAKRKADRDALKASFQNHGVKHRVYSEDARRAARARWLERDLQMLRSELQEEEATT